MSHWEHCKSPDCSPSFLDTSPSFSALDSQSDSCKIQMRSCLLSAAHSATLHSSPACSGKARGLQRCIILASPPSFFDLTLYCFPSFLLQAALASGNIAVILPALCTSHSSAGKVSSDIHTVPSSLRFHGCLKVAASHHWYFVGYFYFHFLLLVTFYSSCFVFLCSFSLTDIYVACFSPLECNLHESINGLPHSTSA